MESVAPTFKVLLKKSKKIWKSNESGGLGYYTHPYPLFIYVFVFLFTHFEILHGCAKKIERIETCYAVSQIVLLCYMLLQLSAFFGSTYFLTSSFMQVVADLYWWNFKTYFFWNGNVTWRFVVYGFGFPFLSCSLHDWRVTLTHML